MAQAAAYGPGTMTITSASVPAGSSGETFALRYTAPSTGKFSGAVAVLVPTSGGPKTAFLPIPARANVTVQRGTCTSAALAASPFTSTTRTAYPGDSPGTQINTVVSCPAGHFFTVTYKTITAPRTPQAYTFYATVTGAPTKAQPVETVTPRRAASLTVAAPATVTAGTSFSIKVTAKDTYANIAPSYRGTIRFASSDLNRAVLPPSYTLTAADKGAHTFAGVVLRTAGSQWIAAKDAVDATITGRAIVTVEPAAVVRHTLWAWGDNSLGQLGDGTTYDRGTPEQVGSDTHWASAAAGGESTVAVKTDGTLWAWGSNFAGELGDGTITSRSTPAQVGSGTHWASARGGAGHTVALRW